MNNNKLTNRKILPASFFMIILFVTSVVSGQTGNAKYKEVVGPAGNEYYDARVIDPVTIDDLPEPVEKQFELLKQNFPPLEVTAVIKNLKSAGIRWRIDLKKNENSDRWIVLIWEDGRLYKIQSWVNDIREEDEAVFKNGNIKEIAINDVPAIVHEKFEPFRAGREITKTYSVDAVTGHRYFIQFGDDENGFIYSLTESGEIRSAAIASDMLLPAEPERVETMTEIESRLKKYGDKYRVKNVIQRIKKYTYNPEKGFRFVVTGDCQKDDEMWIMIVKSINKWNPLFTIVTGDMTPRGFSDMFDEHLLYPLEQYASFPFLPVLGNHDRGNDGIQYEYVFGGDESRVYHFDYGDCRFIILDNGCEKGIMSWEEQLALADKWLAEKPGYKRFVFLHKPPYEIKKWAYHSMTPEYSAPFVKLMSKHKVDHVFCGHIHAYSTATYDGVDYTVNGGAGGSLHMRYGESGSVNHYVIVDIKADSVNMKVVRFYPQTEGN